MGEPQYLSNANLTENHPFFEIIAKAYRIFDYDKPKSIEVCEGCCMDPQIEATFFDSPINELPVHYIQDWYSAAYNPEGIAKSTWGYLLPRILEVLACGEEVSSAGLEVTLNRFKTGDFENWSAEEWQVLDKFQRAFLDRSLTCKTGQLDDSVCMFSLGGWPLDSLLEQIKGMCDETLVLRLWNDWCKDVERGRERIWLSAFWGETERSSVHKFYASELFYNRFSSLAFAENTTTELSEKALAVASVIEKSLRN